MSGAMLQLVTKRYTKTCTAMRISARNSIVTAASIVLLCVVSGCAKEPQAPPKVEPLYKVGFRQLPPEPVYNRMRWGHLPSVITTAKESEAPLILPEMSFELKNGTVKEGLTLLADAVRYSAKVSSLIADRSLSLTATGTLDELAGKIGRVSGVTVVVDHDARELRASARRTPVNGTVGHGSVSRSRASKKVTAKKVFGSLSLNRFFDCKVAEHEYRSDHPSAVV